MISDLNFHLTIRTILQGENFLFSKENEDTYNPTTNGDSFVFFFIFCALAALPTAPVDFFDNSSADCCVEVQVSFDGPNNDNPNYIIQVGNVFEFIISIENIL